jgi:hypothetical protein
MAKINKIIGYKAQVWSQTADFSSLSEARGFVRKMLSIYHDSGINAAMIRWEIKPIYK